MTLDLIEDDAPALAKHLQQAFDADPYPLAPRLDPLKAILGKLDPPAPQPEPLPKVHALSRAVSGRRRRAGPIAMKAGVTEDAGR